MGLTSQSHWTVDVPHEPGEWIEFRRLSGTAITKATNERSRKAIELTRGIKYDSSELADMRALADTQERDPLTLLDQESLLRDSIVSWSYKDQDGNQVAVKIDDLDARTTAWAWSVIVEANMLGETELQRKNGSEPFTPH